MSRVKVSPVEWRDEGPAAPYRPTVRLGGTSLAYAQPVAALPQVVSPSRLAQMSAYRSKLRAARAASRAEREAQPVVLCGRVFTQPAFRGRTCARKQGHGGDCHSRDYMDRAAAKRRTKYEATERTGGYRGPYRHKGPIDEEFAA